MYQIGAVDHGTSRSGRWLRERSFRIALWIAVAEIVLAAFSHDVSRWTIIALAAVFVPLYLLWGRERRNETSRQVLRLAALSQAIAVVGVFAAFLIGVFVLVLAGIFAAVALLMILSDRR